MKFEKYAAKLWHFIINSWMFGLGFTTCMLAVLGLATVQSQNPYEVFFIGVGSLSTFGMLCIAAAVSKSWIEELNYKKRYSILEELYLLSSSVHDFSRGKSYFKGSYLELNQYISAEIAKTQHDIRNCKKRLSLFNLLTSDLEEFLDEYLDAYDELSRYVSLIIARMRNGDTDVGRASDLVDRKKPRMKEIHQLITKIVQDNLAIT